MMNRVKRRRRKSIGKTVLKVMLAILILAIIAITLGCKFTSSRFNYGTRIQGVNCSFLTVKEASEKVQDLLENSYITIQFANGQQYEIQNNEVSLKIADMEEIERFFQEQKENNNRQEYLVKVFSADEEKLKNYLESLPELQTQNMKKSKDAYLLQQSDGTLVIVPEKRGNYIEFSKAYNYIKEHLTSGIFEVDLTSITEVQPDILSTNSELQLEVKKINNALQTEVIYYLPDGTTVVLDRETIKNWIVCQEDGSYKVDVDAHIKEFVKLLDSMVREHNSTINFTTTGLGILQLPLRKDLRVVLNQDAEIQKLTEELANTGTFERQPIYDKKEFTSELNSYIEIDITRQKLWFYLNGICIVDTECVTGCVSKGYSTPTGIYFLDRKTTNTYLKGYNSDGSLAYKSYVNFWMPFNGGIGLHDASWRSESEYIPITYLRNGSHGCVNLRYEVAKTIYENIDSTIPIIIYKS